MLAREMVEEFLDYKFKVSNIKIPEGIPKKALVEMFCQYVEDDLAEWLIDNYKSFFDYGKPDWDWIKENITDYQ